MYSIAIIPARGGSKRVPRKNIKLLKDKPLISYTIIQALESKMFDRIIVSTEDSEIAKIAQEYGAEIIKRPLDLAEDVESELVLKHVINSVYPKPDIISMLQCTSPLRKSETIKKCVNLLQENWTTFDSVITVSDIEGNRPEWMGSLEFNGKFIPYTNTWIEDDKKYIKLVARQDLPKLYHQNGCVYVFKTNLLLKTNSIIGANCGAIVIDEKEAHDLDTELDFLIAEELIK